MLLRTIARPLLGAAFITSGVEAVRAPATPAQVAEPLLESAPLESETLIRAAGALQIGAGVALATGRAPRVASTVLVGTLIPTTVFASDFWNESDPVRKRMKQSAFVKNLGLLGGVMIASADTEGRPSLGWRGRRRLAQAGAAASAAGAALPGHRDEAESTWNEFTERASNTAHDLASHVPVDDIRSTFTDLAKTTRSKVADAADAAPGVFDDVRKRAGDIAGDIAERAPVAAAEARTAATIAGEKTAARARRWRRDLAR